MAPVTAPQASTVPVEPRAIVQEAGAIPRVLAEHAAVGLGCLDGALQIIHANAALAGLCGISQASALGRTLPELFPDTRPLIPALKNALAQTAPQECIPNITTFLIRHGKRRHADLAFRTVLLADNSRGLALTAIDITAQVDAWQSMDRSEQRLKAVASETEQRLKHEQDQLLAGHERFMALLSHELRTPLTPILTWTQLLKEKLCLTPQLSHAIAVIERNALHQKHLVDDLLDLATLHTGEMSFDLEPVLIQSLIENLINGSYGEKARENRIDISFESAAPDARVAGDRRRLEQVFGNLLSNAIKFTAAGGRIWVRLCSDGARACVEIADTGIGIPRAFMSHLFKSFRQADALHCRRRQGLGLGLALVKHLVERHGGSVDARSEGEHKGSAFTVYLPLQNTPVADIPFQSMDGKRRRVLIIEDNDDTREALRTLLHVWEFEVCEAFDGAQGLEAARKFKPDLILCDLTMPVLDGWGVARELRAAPATGGLPLIALTGHGTPGDIARCKECGFTGHLVKPFEARDLLRTLMRHLPAIAEA